MCIPSAKIVPKIQAASLPDGTSGVWQSLTAFYRGYRRGADDFHGLSPHMRRDIGLDDGRTAERP
jgi:hypothetical protein